MIAFTIPGEPQGKGRPRMTKQGHAFTPQKTVLYENWIKCCFLETKQAKFVGKTPISASIEAFYPIPKSASKKARERMITGRDRPMKKPDCDNVVKAVLDSLNGIAYDDDVQVVALSIHKMYSENPCVVVRLMPITEGNGAAS